MITVRRAPDRPWAHHIAGVLAGVAAVLILAAMFVPYMTHAFSVSTDIGPNGEEIISPEGTSRVAHGLWGLEVTPASDRTMTFHEPQYGFVFAGVGIALACAAALSARAARWPSGRAARRAPIVVAASAAAALAAAATLLLGILPVLTFRVPDEVRTSYNLEPNPGLGLWLILGAAVVAVVAAGFAVASGRGERGAGRRTRADDSGIPPLDDGRAVIHWLPPEPEPDQVR